MQYITKSEAHLKSRFLNEDLSGYVILDEELLIDNEHCVLINDKEMLSEGLYAYARKNDVVKILNNYNKSVLTDIYAFNEAYKNTFTERDDNGIVLTEGVVSQTIAKILHIILGGVGFVPGVAVGETADAIDLGLYIGQGVMDLSEKDYAGASIKFVQACLSALSEIPGADAITKPIMAVAGSIDKAKMIVDKLPDEWKKKINDKVQEMLSDTSFEEKINNAVKDFKKKAKEEGMSGAIGQGIDNTVGKVPVIGGALSTVARAGSYFQRKGLDVLVAAAKKAGVDPINAIPDNLGSLIMKAFRDFANKVFTVKGSITQPVKDVITTGQQRRQQASNSQPLPAAAMKNRN